MASILIITIIIVLAMVGLHISFYTNRADQFNLVMRLFLITAIVHALHAALIRIVDVESFYSATPFALVYGPLLYLGFKSSSGKKISGREFLAHGIPFLLFILIYLFILFDGDFKDSYIQIYYLFLYGTISFSWMFYAVLVLSTSFYEAYINNPKNKLMILSATVLMILSFFRLQAFFTRIINGQDLVAESSGVILYLGMLGAVILVYLYFFQEFVKLINSSADEIGAVHELYKEPKEALNKEVEKQVSYIKASLPENYEILYGSTFNRFVLSEKYLDPALSLTKLSKDLSIPKHHLSQLFNLNFGQTYLQFVNSKRIVHACVLLEEQKKDLIIDDLAELCGFRSKATFYRNFREIVKMTPSEYSQHYQITQEKFRV